MAEALIEGPEDLEDGDSLCDWAEVLLLLEDRGSMPRAELTRRLRGSGDSDLGVGLLLEQVDARSRRAPETYPFRRDESGLLRKEGVQTGLYELLLWSSWPQSPVRISHDYRAIDRLFDRVVLKAILAYLGPRAMGVRFGTPASDGRPTGFADALVWLGEMMDIEATGSLPSNDDKNDAGADVVVWVPFGDARSDMMIAIGQCTFRTDWTAKAAELAAAAILWGGGWLALGERPITVLAVPFTLTSSHKLFPEIRQLVTVVLDRIRLCELIASPYDQDLGEIEAWAAEARSEIMSGGNGGETKTAKKT